MIAGTATVFNNDRYLLLPRVVIIRLPEKKKRDEERRLWVAILLVLMPGMAEGNLIRVTSKSREFNK